MRDQSHSSRRQHSRNQALPFWPIYSNSSSVAPSATRTISSSQKLELLAPTGHIGEKNRRNIKDFSEKSWSRTRRKLTQSQNFSCGCADPEHWIFPVLNRGPRRRFEAVAGQRNSSHGSCLAAKAATSTRLHLGADGDPNVHADPEARRPLASA